MEIILTFAILAAAIFLFATEKFSVDFVAILVLTALLATNILTVQEALSGFANPATVTVGLMFVLSAALERTGALEWFGFQLLKFGTSYQTLLFVIMLTVGIASAFANNTAVVAVFLPIIVATSYKIKKPASLFLIPLSYASQAGGVCTLIGTSTNLIVSAISHNLGYGEFSFFEFGKLGVILLVLSIVYFFLAGRALLPNRPTKELTETYQLRDYIAEFRINKDSPYIGKPLKETQFSSLHDVSLLKLIRNDLSQSKPHTVALKEGDILLLEGKIQELLSMKGFDGLDIESEFKLKSSSLKEEDTKLLEVLIPPRSRLIEQTLQKLNFNNRFNLIVLALQREGKNIYEKLSTLPLKVGDALLVQGHKEDVENLKQNKNFIVLESSIPQVALKQKAPLALLILFFVVAAAALKLFPVVTCALLGVILVLITGCIKLSEVYEVIDWKVILLLGGIFPLGIALEKTGAAEWLVKESVGLIDQMGPAITLSCLYLITTILTEAMSNNATAILLAPIAASIALNLEVSPKPFLMAVCFAASTSFLTPVGYQTNAMIYTPGGYKYTDFIKVGLPLNLLFWIVSSLLIPVFWPF